MNPISLQHPRLQSKVLQVGDQAVERLSWIETILTHIGVWEDHPTNGGIFLVDAPGDPTGGCWIEHPPALKGYRPDDAFTRAAHELVEAIQTSGQPEATTIILVNYNAAPSPLGQLCVALHERAHGIGYGLQGRPDVEANVLPDSLMTKWFGYPIGLVITSAVFHGTGRHPERIIGVREAANSLLKSTDVTERLVGAAVVLGYGTPKRFKETTSGLVRDTGAPSPQRLQPGYSLELR